MSRSNPAHRTATPPSCTGSPMLPVLVRHVGGGGGLGVGVSGRPKLGALTSLSASNPGSSKSPIPEADGKGDRKAHNGSAPTPKRRRRAVRSPRYSAQPRFATTRAAFRGCIVPGLFWCALAHARARDSKPMLLRIAARRVRNETVRDQASESSDTGFVAKLRAGSTKSCEHPSLERPCPANVPKDPRSGLEGTLGVSGGTALLCWGS